jgi:hypothetical protein
MRDIKYKLMYLLKFYLPFFRKYKKGQIIPTKGGPIKLVKLVSFNNVFCECWTVEFVDLNWKDDMFIPGDYVLDYYLENPKAYLPDPMTLFLLDLHTKESRK